MIGIHGDLNIAHQEFVGLVQIANRDLDAIILFLKVAAKIVVGYIPEEYGHRATYVWGRSIPSNTLLAVATARVWVASMAGLLLLVFRSSSAKAVA